MMQGTNLQHASNTRREEQSARMEHQNRHNSGGGWRYTSTSSMTTTNSASSSTLPPFSISSGAGVVQTNHFSIPSFAPPPRHNNNTEEEQQEGNKNWFARGAGREQDLYYPNAGAGMIVKQDDECWLPLSPFSSFAGGPCTISPADASAAGWCWDGIPTAASYYKTDYSNQFHQYQQESSSSLPPSATSSRGAGLVLSEDLITSSFGGPCTAAAAAAGWDEVIPTASYYKTDNSNHQYYPQYQQESSSPCRGGAGLGIEDLTSSPTVIEPIPFSEIQFPRGNDDYSDCSNRKRPLAAFTFEEEETNNMILPTTSAVLPPKTNSDDIAGARNSWVQTNSRPTKSSKFKRTGTISSGATMFDESHKPSV